MLKNEFEPVDLLAVFNQYWPEVEAGLDDGIKTDVEVMASADAMLELEFPANSYPSKISSFNLDKNPLVEGRLDAIKGQYLIMNTGVINIRKYSGYLVSLEA